MSARLPIQSLLLLSALAIVAPPLRGQDSAAAASDSGTRKLLEMFELMRSRSAHDYDITAPNGIDEGRYVTLGGIEQWITIRGEDRRNPVLLLLHGGPGDATNPWGYAGFHSWHRHFTVVQWDQRGTGRTLGKTGPSVAPTITVERMARDGIELAEHLRAALGQEKILLVGHSWGSILGNYMVKARPELFSAFVATGLVADPARNYPVAYQAVLAKARVLGDRTAVEELESIGPPPWSEGRRYQVQRKWANRYEGADAFIASMVGFALRAPGYTSRDMLDWFEGQLLTGGRLFERTSAIPRDTLGGTFRLPVYVIQGAEDFTTPTSLAREFVARIRAPGKAFVAMPAAGHFAVFMRQDAFLEALLPLVRRSSRGTPRRTSPRRRSRPPSDSTTR